MSNNEKKGSIYKITCIPTGLCYVGQTRDTKTKAGKEYAYGVRGRWSDHVSTKSSTPLNQAIQQYGPEAFRVEELEKNVAESCLDEREAHWISTLDSCAPNGYNKMRHGRCRHRESSSLAKFYAPTTTSIRVRQIKRDDVPRLNYVYLLQDSGEDVRVVFGQGKESTYADAVRDARTFLEAFPGVPTDVEPCVFDETVSEYEDKLRRFDGQTITKIRVAKFNTLAAVYVDKDARICFGGKKTPYDQAVMKAMAFAQTLQNKHPEATLINSTSKSATGGCLPR